MLKVAITNENRKIDITGGIYFGLVSPPPNRELCSAMFECRDYLNDYTQWVVKGMPASYDNSLNWLATSTTKPDFDKLRLLIGTKKDGEAKKKIFFAKKLINILEKEMKFATSKITSVTIETTNPKINTTGVQYFLLTGPSVWMLNPQTLSFVTFVFKSCFFTSYAIIKKHEEIATVEDIKKYFLEVYTTPDVSKINLNSNYTRSYVNLFLDNINFFIEKFNDIFISEPVQERFPPTTYSVHSNWGIMSLFGGSATNIKNLNNRYKKAMEDYKKEKE